MLRSFIVAALLALPSPALATNYAIGDHVITCDEGCKSTPREQFFERWPSVNPDNFQQATRGVGYAPHVRALEAEMRRLGYLDPPLEGVHPREAGPRLPRPNPAR